MTLPLPLESLQQPSVQSAIAEIWEHFKGTLAPRITLLEQSALAMQAGRLDVTLRHHAAHEAHKLVGALGTFGVMEGSRLAREIEGLLQTSLAADAMPPCAARLLTLCTELRSVLALPPLPPPAPAEVPVPVETGSCLLVISRDTALATQVVNEAQTRGIQAAAVPDCTAAQQAISSAPPHLILLDLSDASSGSDGLAVLTTLTEQVPHIPVLVVTDRDTFVDRIEVARLGGRGFLRKPLPATQILEAVTALLTQTRSATMTILAVDDDPQILAMLQAFLAPQGFRIIAVDDPRRFWDLMEETVPDLLILDVNMPYIDGTVLCRVVRNEPRWRGLPVLFLTAHTDAAVVQQAFAAGADDYLHKPIIKAELMARIYHRLERACLLRHMAETDILTGLANRRKAIQMLEHLLHLASRQGQPLCLAVLDLDHFKHINDRHGHAMGDQVLQHLGQLLLQSFRGEDVVARWGGEEFVVGLYGMPPDVAVRRLTGVLERLRQTAFASEDGTDFQVTFSAGVAAYPRHGTELLSLYRVADQTLYQAKAAGRNRIALSD